MLKFRNIISGTRRGAVAFLRDSEGAVAFYVALIIVLLVAFVGIAVDFSRLYTTNSQAQAAADAAAIAAAYQLDGSSDAITRATLAAQGTPLVNNDQNFAEGDEIVQIAQLRFLHSLPPNDTDPITDVFVTTNPESVRFVEVTTETLTQNNIFLTAVGANSGTTLAVAVAGYKSMVCRYPPLMMCNPYETPTSTSFPINPLRGVALLAKSKPNTSDPWAPGDFGLLDPPTYDWDTKTNTGAKAVAEEIASATPDQCFELYVEIRPGSVESMRNALNVRFDMWSTPFFGGSANSDYDYRPARNVTKGKIVTKVDGKCTWSDPPVPPAGELPAAMAMPTDTCFGSALTPGECGTSVAPPDSLYLDRVGDGEWDRDTYWAVNHPALAEAAKPAGYADMSRYQVYRWETDSGNIPNNTASTPAGEDGTPQCFSWDTGEVANDLPDRRVVYMAVINCIDQGPLAGGSNVNVEVEAFVKMFLIRPLEGEPDVNIWLEFIEKVKPGNTDGVLHDMVQLYR
jgi:Flp pilus assembly protein TadG